MQNFGAPVVAVVIAVVFLDVRTASRVRRRRQLVMRFMYDRRTYHNGFSPPSTTPHDHRHHIVYGVVGRSRVATSTG